MKHYVHVAFATLGVLCATGSAQERSKFGLPGVTQPSQQVTLSVPVEGVLSELLVTEGTEVEAGQPIARLDDRIARAAVASAAIAAQRTSEIEHARQELRLAELKVARLESVAGTGAVRALDLDEARTRLAQSKASLASAMEAKLQAERNLELERARLDRLTIVAPFAGTITRIEAQPGTTVTTSMPLAQLVCLETLRAEMFVPAGHLSKLTPNTPYDLRAQAPINETIGGMLVFVDPVLNSATGTVRCLFEIPNPGERLPAGIAVNLIGPRQQPAKPAESGR